MAMKLDHDDLDRLIEKISTSDIQEFSLEGEDFKLEIKRNLLDKNQSTSNSSLNNSFEKPITASKLDSSDNVSLASNAEPSLVAPPGLSDLTDITSPMVGTFYASASPESKPFVTIGQSVKKGDTLCILEAMKMMNQVQAESDGKIVEILVDNAEPVEFDQPLFVLE